MVVVVLQQNRQDRQNPRVWLIKKILGVLIDILLYPLLIETYLSNIYHHTRIKLSIIFVLSIDSISLELI